MNAHYGLGKEGRSAFFNEYFSRTSVEASGVYEAHLDLETLLEKSKVTMQNKSIAWFSLSNADDSNAIFEVGTIHKTLSDSRDKWLLDANTGELIESQIGQSSSKSFYYVLRSLHEGLFASTPLRWLYFLTGLFGTAMIASGMVLWTVKRRSKALKTGGGTFGYRFTEGLNLSCLLGLPAGVAVYLLANRLIPEEMSDRAMWEVNALFITWGLFTLYAVGKAILRKADFAWVSLTYLTASFYALVPVVNTLTTDHNIIFSLKQQNWVFVGVDLLCVFTSFILFFLANYLRKMFKTEPVKSGNSNEKFLQGEQA